VGLAITLAPPYGYNCPIPTHAGEWHGFLFTKGKAVPIKLIRLMDAYGERVDKIDSRRLQEVRDAALRLVADIQKVLKKRDEEDARVAKRAQ
jgi:hypothetical protein